MDLVLILLHAVFLFANNNYAAMSKAIFRTILNMLIYSLDLFEAHGRLPLSFAEQHFFGLGSICHGVLVVEGVNPALTVHVCFNLTIGPPFFEENVPNA